jgi:hypothetical protein
MGLNNADKEKLFRQFRHSLGAPHRQIEVDDDQLCTFLEMAVEDYAQYVQEWLVEHQWQSLLGQSIDKTDMAFALSVRNFDFMTQYTYAYSKQVGLQANGPWELKKDFIDVVPGQQVYTIPADREVNEVLWITPSVTDMALFSSMGGIDVGFGGGFGQIGAGAAGGGMGAGGTGGYYIAPAFDVLLKAQDFNLKNRLLRSELVYKLTAGPNGTKLLHLLSVPGSKLSFGNALGGGAAGGSINLAGCQVWYHYYDTNGNVDECRLENPDIIKLPNDVPLARLDYDKFNEPTKTLVRKLFIGHSKRALGRTRGKFGGVVGPPEAQLTMDYDSLVTEGNEDIKNALERLDGRLERLSSEKQVK